MTDAEMEIELRAFLEGYTLGKMNAQRQQAGVTELDMFQKYHDWRMRQMTKPDRFDAPAVKPESGDEL